MPRPPEYCGSAAVMPYSGEKYAIAAGLVLAGDGPGSPSSAYQRGSDMYRRRSRSASASRPRNSSSAASAAMRADGSALSMATGSPPDARQAAGSMDANRSAVGRG